MPCQIIERNKGGNSNLLPRLAPDRPVAPLVRTLSGSAILLRFQSPRIGCSDFAGIKCAAHRFKRPPSVRRDGFGVCLAYTLINTDVIICMLTLISNTEPYFETKKSVTILAKKRALGNSTAVRHGGKFRLNCVSNSITMRNSKLIEIRFGAHILLILERSGIDSLKMLLCSAFR